MFNPYEADPCGCARRHLGSLHVPPFEAFRRVSTLTSTGTDRQSTEHRIHISNPKLVRGFTGDAKGQFGSTADVIWKVYTISNNFNICLHFNY